MINLSANYDILQSYSESSYHVDDNITSNNTSKAQKKFKENLLTVESDLCNPDNMQTPLNNLRIQR